MRAHHCEPIMKLVKWLSALPLRTLLPSCSLVALRLKIPLVCHESSTCNISPNDQMGQLLQKTKLIIWDEVPMHGRKQFEAVHHMLCDVRGCDELFGGTPVVSETTSHRSYRLSKVLIKLERLTKTCKILYLAQTSASISSSKHAHSTGEANQRFSE